MDEAVDVLDAHGLGVQIDHGGGFVLKHGSVEIVAAIAGGDGLPVRLLGCIDGGGGGLAGRGGALQRYALARGEGVDLLGGIGHLLLGRGGLGEGLVASGLALLALGLGGLSGGGGLGGDGRSPSHEIDGAGEAGDAARRGWRRGRGVCTCRGGSAVGESARAGKGRRSRVGCARRVGAPPGRGGARERKQIQVKPKLLIP